MHKTTDRLISVLNHNIEFFPQTNNQSFLHFSRRKKNGRIKCWSFGKDSCRHSCKIGKNFWTYFILYNKSVVSFISFFNVGHFFWKKLQKELGAYVDDELPDYIMVLVANKKTQEQMKDDLSLFLHNHADVFTDWLQDILNKLKQVATTGGKKKTGI